jgi:hypothetical protein
MAKGGKREGAGNKAGSIRPKITDYWSQDDIQEYFDHLKENYKKSDRLAVFVGEHLMGKAVQPIGNDNGQPLLISFDQAFKQ